MSEIINPKKDTRGQYHYIKYPVKRNNGKWVAVDVVENGFVDRGFLLNEFENQEDCQKSCDVHNKYHGWSNKEVNLYVYKSMCKSINENQ